MFALPPDTSVVDLDTSPDSGQVALLIGASCLRRDGSTSDSGRGRGRRCGRHRVLGPAWQRPAPSMASPLRALIGRRRATASSLPFETARSSSSTWQGESTPEVHRAGSSRRTHPRPSLVSDRSGHCLRCGQSGEQRTCAENARRGDRKDDRRRSRPRLSEPSSILHGFRTDGRCSSPKADSQAERSRASISGAFNPTARDASSSPVPAPWRPWPGWRWRGRLRMAEAWPTSPWCLAPPVRSLTVSGCGTSPPALDFALICPKPPRSNALWWTDAGLAVEGLSAPAEGPGGLLATLWLVDRNGIVRRLWMAPLPAATPVAATPGATPAGG